MSDRVASTPFLDFLAPTHADSARACLLRASVCSRLAKLVAGSVRRKLYQLKDQNILRAIVLSGGEVEIRCDKDLYFGLISIRLNGFERVRVHSHENWLAAAEASSRTGAWR